MAKSCASLSIQHIRSCPQNGAAQWLELDVETLVKLVMGKHSKKDPHGKKTRRSVRPKPSANNTFVRKLLREAALPHVRNTGASQSTAPGLIRLGSDCSGYGSEFLALKQCGLPVKTTFCAEIDGNKTKMLKRMHEMYNDDDFHLYTDIKTRDCNLAPDCDIFVSGAPCQAFSSAGHGAGLDDLKDRGVTLFFSLDYVRHKRPKVVIIENVEGLTFKKHAHVLNSVTAILEGLQYAVYKQLVNTRNHGIPQNRPRLYIIAILASAKRHKFEWPTHVAEPDIARFLDVEQSGRKRDMNDLTPCALKNIVHFRDNMRKQHDVDILDDWYVVDTHAGKQYRSMAHNRCPCITKARGASRGFFVTRLKRHLTVIELARLQGVPTDVAHELLDAANGDHKILGQGVGDAMSLNVLMRLLPRALRAAGLVPRLPFDVWARMPPASGILPDVLYKRGSDVGDSSALDAPSG